MATNGHFSWPSVGSSVAAYGQFFMAANRPPCPHLGGDAETIMIDPNAVQIRGGRIAPVAKADKQVISAKCRGIFFVENVSKGGDGSRLGYRSMTQPVCVKGRAILVTRSVLQRPLYPFEEPSRHFVDSKSSAGGSACFLHRL